ncbi:MAG: DMT family transporter [Spirochaetales bacterium]|nr:DMT family transporter [Spirochaetales bacterium]
MADGRQSERNAGRMIAGYALALLATALWAGNMLVARAFKGAIPPVSLATLRWTLAVAAFAPFAARSLYRERAALRASLGHVAATGLLGVALFTTLVYVAGRSTAALNLGLISITFPVFIMLFARVLYGERIHVLRVAGLVIVFSGVALLLVDGDLAALRSLAFAPGDFVMLFASVVFAAYSLLVRARPKELPVPAFQFATFAAGLAFLLPAFAVERLLSGPLVLEPGILGAVLYVGLGASLVAFVAWNGAIERIGATKAGLVYYTVPLFSGFGAWLFLGEPVGAVHLAAGALVLTGILLATAEKRAKA